MKKILPAFFVFLFFVSQVKIVSAVQNPLEVANNKIGIHILFTTELAKAAELVNSSGGDWGYVTIPIQAQDTDLEKWQTFMDNARANHLIPIVRLATEGDYFNTKVWRKPTEADILDFANFLNSLTWPTKNRYVIIFNEANRADEWGGEVNPAEYASLLSYAVSVFKSKSQDFFILSAGLDNAAPSMGDQYINEYTFLRQMNEAVPGIFNQIDGIASHSYPNPGFSQPPTVNTKKSIASFKYERETIESLATKDIPVFITETGWSSDTISDADRAKYYIQAFQSVWADDKIVAVTPFLLDSGSPFNMFSFFTSDGNQTEQYRSLQQMVKVKGQPLLTPTLLELVKKSPPITDIKDYSDTQSNKHLFSLSDSAQRVFRWIMKIQDNN